MVYHLQEPQGSSIAHCVPCRAPVDLQQVGKTANHDARPQRNTVIASSRRGGEHSAIVKEAGQPWNAPRLVDWWVARYSLLGGSRVAWNQIVAPGRRERPKLSPQAKKPGHGRGPLLVSRAINSLSVEAKGPWASRLCPRSVTQLGSGESSLC